MFILDTEYVYCAALGANTAIPIKIPQLISLIYTIILIAVPILLILFGAWDLGKAVMAQKEDEIKKGQQTFVKRLISAVIVFLVLVIVKLVVGLVAESNYFMDCASCMLSNKCSSTIDEACCKSNKGDWDGKNCTINTEEYNECKSKKNK